MADYGRNKVYVSGGADFGDPTDNLKQAIQTGKVPAWMKNVTFIRAFLPIPEQREWERRFDYIPLPEWCYEEYSGVTQFIGKDGRVVHQMPAQEWEVLLSTLKSGHMLAVPGGNQNAQIIPPNAAEITPMRIKRSDGWIDYTGPMGLRYLAWAL